MTIRSIVMVAMLLVMCNSFVSKEALHEPATPEKKSIKARVEQFKFQSLAGVQHIIGKLKRPQAAQKVSKRGHTSDIDGWFRSSFGKANKKMRKMVHNQRPLLKKSQAIRKKEADKGK